MNSDLTPGLDAYGHLWMAVLRQAVDDATVPAHNRNHVYERRTARAWLRADGVFVGSCRWICEMLGLEVDVIRSEMARRLKFGTPRRRKRVNTAGYLHQ